MKKKVIQSGVWVVRRNQSVPAARPDILFASCFSKMDPKIQARKLCLLGNGVALILFIASDLGRRINLFPIYCLDSV